MKKLALIAALAATGLCPTAFAADGTINFTGSIRDTACTVNTGSATQTVNLGTVAASAFGAAGSQASARQFAITLTNCPSAVTSASIRFDGPLASGNSSLLGLTSGTGVATGVGVGIYEKDSTTLIPIGQASSAVTLSSTGSNTLNFIAKYVSTAATVGPGAANAAATFTVAYN